MGYKAVAMVIVQTVFSLGTLLLNYFYCKHKLHIKIWFQNFNYTLFKEIMVFSWWNFLGAIVDRIYWNTGQFFLGIYCGTAAIAIFSLAITLNNLYITMSTAFNSVLLPRVTIMATKHNDIEISNLFIKTGRLQFTILCLITCGFVVFGKPFIEIWAGESYAKSYTITLIFFITLICPLIQNLGISILLARGQQKFRSLSYLGIAVLSIIGQYYITPKYGAVGCAWVIAISHYIGQWLVMNIYYYKKQKINIPEFWKQIIKMSIFPVIFTLGFYLIARHFNIDEWWRFGTLFLLYLSFYIIGFYIFSMNKYERDLVLNPSRQLFKNSINNTI